MIPVPAVCSSSNGHCRLLRPTERAGQRHISGSRASVWFRRARALGEFGDDKGRFADSRARKETVVLARYATNRRLGDALHLQASSALVASPGARAYYDALRARKIGHHAALRQLANRLVSILHGCLKTGTKYDEKTAWQRQIVAAA
jgi:hypothetical protein